MRIQVPRSRHDIARPLTAVGSLVAAVVGLGFMAPQAAGLNVINESQSVIPSQCVGNTCSTTSNPERTLVLRTDNTPTIRFDQSAGAYPNQIWDLAANEANFFLRDQTAGGRLVFRVFPGSPANALTIKPTGVGLGTDVPTTALHIKRNGAGMTIHDEGPAGPARVLADLAAAGAPLIRLRDTEETGTSWLLGSGDSGGFVVRPAGGDASESFVITPAGSARAIGVLEQGASAAAFTDVSPVNQNEILTRLRALPISSWKTPGDETGARHLGPSGSDFRKAFGLGASDSSIAPANLAAVGLVATKELAAQMDANLGRVDGRLKAVEANGPAVSKESSLRRTAVKQAKQIRTLTRRQRSMAKNLRKLNRQVRSLARSRR